MALNFHPNPGTLLVCDFHGLSAPEMVKTRPVIVISPRLRRSTGLCTLVPLSTTPPKPVLPWHCKLQLEEPLSPNWNASDIWAKCDMLYTMRFERLDRFYHTTHRHRTYYDRHLNAADWLRVKEAVFAFLNHTCA